MLILTVYTGDEWLLNFSIFRVLIQYYMKYQIQASYWVDLAFHKQFEDVLNCTVRQHNVSMDSGELILKLV